MCGGDEGRHPVLFPMYAVAGEGLYFVAGPDRDRCYRTLFFDFATSTTRSILSLNGKPESGLAISRDGRSLLSKRTSTSRGAI